MSLGAKPAQYGQYTPPDLAGLRGQNINLLQGILSGGGMNSPQFQQLFGNLGSPENALQGQTAQGVSQFLNQPAPEQQALNTAMPFLQNLLGNNPGQGIMQALQPQFQQNLATANQQGARFGSGNEILRSRAVGDYNLLAQNAMQQGVSQQLQGTQALQMLSGAAGNNPFQRLMGGYGIGQQQAQQADLGTQRGLGALMQLLGVGQQSSLGGPVVQNTPYDPGWGRRLISTLGQIGAGAAGQWGGSSGGAGGSGGGAQGPYGGATGWGGLGP